MAYIEILIWILISILSTFVIFMLLYYKWYGFNFWMKCRKIPAVKKHFIIGVGLEMAKLKPEDIFPWVAEKWKELGEIGRISAMGWTTVMLKNAEDIEALLSNNKYLTKGHEYNLLGPWMGEGLLTSTGEKWHVRRKQLTPTFHFQILDNYVPVFNSNARLLTKELNNQNNYPIEIGSVVSSHTLNIICETTMGTRLNLMSEDALEYITAIKKCGDIVFQVVHNFWWYNIWIFSMSPIGREYKRLIKKIHTFVKKIIEKRKQRNLMAHNFKSSITTEDKDGSGIYKQRRSFLDHLFDIQRADAESLTDADILDEVNTFLFEGHDTISSAITWVLFMLATYPDIQDKVRAEILEILPAEDVDMSIQDISKLRYLEMVIKETLRLYPSVPYITRRMPEDLQLKKYLIPAETNIAVIPYLIHRNSAVFEDPEKFDPERFSPSRSRTYHPYAYLPFSAGYRNCIGQRFAMMEAKIMLSTVLRKVQVFTTLKREDIKIIPAMVLRAHPQIILFFKSIEKGDEKTIFKFSQQPKPI